MEYKNITRRCNRPPAAERGVMWRSQLANCLPWVSGELTIRPSQPDDAELMFDLDNNIEVRRYLGGPLRNNVERARIALEQNPLSIYIIEADEIGVGYTGFIENDKTDGMDILIVVSPDVQRKAIGSRAFKMMVEAWTRNFPDKPLAVTTQVENNKARSLLEKAGFTHTGDYEDILGFKYVIYKAT